LIGEAHQVIKNAKDGEQGQQGRESYSGPCGQEKWWIGVIRIFFEGAQLRQEIMGRVIHNGRYIGEEMEGDVRRSNTKRIANRYFTH